MSVCTHCLCSGPDVSLTPKGQEAEQWVTQVFFKNHTVKLTELYNLRFQFQTSPPPKPLEHDYSKITHCSLHLRPGLPVTSISPLNQY